MLRAEREPVVSRWIGRTILRVSRWRIDGEPPPIPKFVLIAAPHTSNWDLLYLLAMAFATGVRISWLGKHSLFKGPSGPVLRRLGGIPVRRDRSTGLVASLSQEFQSADRLVVVFPPAGTRGRTDHWRTGFYRVASAAEVPIVCGYLDYSKRVGGFGPIVHPNGDIAADFSVFRSFYADKEGKYPDQRSAVALADDATR